jgi:hypothetical protein
MPGLNSRLFHIPNRNRDHISTHEIILIIPESVGWPERQAAPLHDGNSGKFVNYERSKTGQDLIRFICHMTMHIRTPY